MPSVTYGSLYQSHRLFLARFPYTRARKFPVQCPRDQEQAAHEERGDTQTNPGTACFRNGANTTHEPRDVLDKEGKHPVFI